MNALSGIATFYKEGGVFMHFVFVIAMLINAIVIDRLIVIGKATRLNARKLTDDLVHRVTRGDLSGARHQVVGANAPAARVAEAMLHAAPADEDTLQSAADDAATLVMPDLTKRLAYMGMLANSATLIGLLGTITGLITAISGVGAADAAERSAHLASGISEALHTTAFGLIVAIPTLLMQGWLSGRVDGVAESIDQLVIRLGKALSRPASNSASHGQTVALPRPAAAQSMNLPRTAGGAGGGR